MQKLPKIPFFDVSRPLDKWNNSQTDITLEVVPIFESYFNIIPVISKEINGFPMTMTTQLIKKV